MQPKPVYFVIAALSVSGSHSLAPLSTLPAALKPRCHCSQRSPPQSLLPFLTTRKPYKISVSPTMKTNFCHSALTCWVSTDTQGYFSHFVLKSSILKKKSHLLCNLQLVGSHLFLTLLYPQSPSCMCDGGLSVSFSGGSCDIPEADPFFQLKYNTSWYKS